MKAILQPRVPHRAFSLIELLFVMLIMIGLAALTIGVMGPVKQQVARQQTQTLIKSLETGLAAYNADYGSYPISNDANEGGEILYASLFGDYNHNGIPDKSANDLNDTSVKMYMAMLQPPKIDPKTGQPIGSSHVTQVSNKYTVVDAWGEKIFYVNFEPGANSSALLGGGIHNPTYDIWSLANTSTSVEDGWIRNW